MQITNDVLEVLSRAEVNGNALTLTGQLDRALYVNVNKVLEAAGGRWDRKAKAHLFDCDAEQRMDEIILSGEVEIPKDDFGYFPSPPAVVKRLLELAGIEDGMFVLEPSAGSGAIAFACAKAGAIVDCCELMEKNFLVLAGHKYKELQDVLKIDFLEVKPHPIYDRVVMNPPFAKRADIHHVRHAHKFLKPGGLLVSVMSAGVQFRGDRLASEFREFVAERGGSIEALPDGAFKASGTMVNTVVVVIQALRGE